MSRAGRRRVVVVLVAVMTLKLLSQRCSSLSWWEHMRLVDHLDTIERVFLAADCLLAIRNRIRLLVNVDRATKTVRAWLFKLGVACALWEACSIHDIVRVLFIYGWLSLDCAGVDSTTCHVTSPRIVTLSALLSHKDISLSAHIISARCLLRVFLWRLLYRICLKRVEALARQLRMCFAHLLLMWVTSEVFFIPAILISLVYFHGNSYPDVLS